jgi:hypothetical protein
MQIISDKWKCEEIQAFKWIKKIGNTFKNTQQMSIQQVVHICLFIPLYHSIKAFQFINICEENNTTFFLLPQ